MGALDNLKFEMEGEEVEDGGDDDAKDEDYTEG